MSMDVHRRRQRKRRLRHLRYAALALGGVAVLGVIVGVLLWVEPRPPQDPPAPLPPPMVDATAPPPSVTALPPDSTSATPGAPLVRLAVLGDAGTREATQARVAAQIKAADSDGRPFDALLITGDLIYEEGDSDLTDASVVRPYAATFTRDEIIAALGNHDIESDEGTDIMRRLGRPGPVYVQDVGPVRVITLDSTRVTTAQTEWLLRVLDQPRPASTWLVALMHHPAYSSGEHGSEEDVRRAWVPVFAREDVDVVLAGHDHSYERTKPQNGVTYIVSGGGGAGLYDVGRSSFTATSAKKHHFVDLTVFADRIEGRAVDVDGTVFDTFSIPLNSAN